jgi:hypothetical protein
MYDLLGTVMINRLFDKTKKNVSFADFLCFNDQLLILLGKE